MNFEDTRSDLIISLNNCIDNWCTKHENHKSNFSKWKQTALKLVDGTMSELSRQPKYNASSILKEHHPSNNSPSLNTSRQGHQQCCFRLSEIFCSGFSQRTWIRKQ